MPQALESKPVKKLYASVQCKDIEISIKCFYLVIFFLVVLFYNMFFSFEPKSYTSGCLLTGGHQLIQLGWDVLQSQNRGQE